MAEPPGRAARPEAGSSVAPVMHYRGSLRPRPRNDHRSPATSNVPPTPLTSQNTRVVGDHSVDPDLVETSRDLRIVHGPCEDGDAEVVAALDGGARHNAVIQSHGRGSGLLDEAAYAKRERSAQRPAHRAGDVDGGAMSSEIDTAARIGPA